MTNEISQEVVDENSKTSIYDANLDITIYPSEAQIQKIRKGFSAWVRVYNFCVERFYELWEKFEKEEITPKELRDGIHNFTLRKLVCKTRNDGGDLAWLKEADAHIIDQSTKAFSLAAGNFLKWWFTPKAKKSSAPKFGKPRFLSSKYRKKSYRTHGCCRIVGNKIKLPSLKGLIPWRHKGYEFLDGREISTVCVYYDGKDYHAVLTTKVEKTKHDKTDKHIGIDVGVKTAVTASDSQVFDYKMSLSERRRRKRADRRLSRRAPKKGETPSKNYFKAKDRHTRLYRRETNRRKNFQHNITTKLVRENDIISLEDLNVKGMVKNHHIARAISEIGFASIRSMLEYKGRWYGCEVKPVDRFFPSSQRCSNCGFKDVNMKNLSKRTFKCPHCGNAMDRDLNAAVNIDTLGSSGIGAWHAITNACGEFITFGPAPKAQKAPTNGRKKQEKNPKIVNGENNELAKSCDSKG